MPPRMKESCHSPNSSLPVDSCPKTQCSWVAAPSCPLAVRRRIANKPVWVSYWRMMIETREGRRCGDGAWVSRMAAGRSAVGGGDGPLPGDQAGGHRASMVDDGFVGIARRRAEVRHGN